jgi:hypothetical protein
LGGDVSLVKNVSTVPEEEGSSYIRNVGNMPPLKRKIDIIIYETVSQTSVTAFVTEFRQRRFQYEKIDKENHGIKEKQEQGPICEQTGCCCWHSRGRAGMRMEVSCFAQTRMGLNILLAISF